MNLVPDLMPARYFELDVDSRVASRFPCVPPIPGRDRNHKVVPQQQLSTTAAYTYIFAPMICCLTSPHTRLQSIRARRLHLPCPQNPTAAKQELTFQPWHPPALSTHPCICSPPSYSRQHQRSEVLSSPIHHPPARLLNAPLHLHS